MDIVNALGRSQWGLENYRDQKDSLVKETQEALSGFKPITNNEYEDNPIQVLDFFSGAGGTSLGFAALNYVVPAFKMMGGCDINEISAATYSHNYGTRTELQ